MSVVRKALSTESFSSHLSDRQRYIAFAELFEHFSNTGELDPADDIPFKASMNSIAIGTTLLGRCKGTFKTVRRDRRQVLATNDDRYCLARNAENHDAYLVHRGREFRLRPGSMALLKLDEPFSGADGKSYKRFTNVHLPTAALQAMVKNIDDLVGVELAAGGALSLAMDYSEILLNHDRAIEEAGPLIAAHLLDLAALGLGARKDVAEVACKKGLRTVRLDNVLAILNRRLPSRIFLRMRWRQLPVCPNGMSTSCFTSPVRASVPGCWNCACGRPSIFWDDTIRSASATLRSHVGSTICPISTGVSADASV